MQEIYSSCKEYVIENGRFPHKDEKYEIVDKVYEKIEERQIWIPYDEVYNHFLSKVTKLKKRLKNENLLFEENGKLKLFRKVILPLTISLDGYIIDIDDEEIQKQKESYTDIADTFITKESIFNKESGNEIVLKEVIDNLRKEIGKHIVILGKSTLINSFIEDDLVDEYVIRIKPLIQGERGKYSFRPNIKMKLKLLSMKKEKEDVILNYKRIR